MDENVFEQMAKRYDTPDRQQLATIIAAKVIDALPEATEKTLVDYGSGTGLVSLQLAPYVKQLLLVDASQQMLDVAATKIVRQQLHNVRTHYADFTNETPDLTADLVFMSLVLLHIPDTSAILKSLATILKPGGKLYIVDFDQNRAVAHPKVHSGFEHKALTALLERAGFQAIQIESFYKGEKLFMNQDAALFLCQATKG